MTPQTQLLYAYTESPLLKNELTNSSTTLIGGQFKNLHSKKMINFDQEVKDTDTN